MDLIVVEYLSTTMSMMPLEETVYRIDGIVDIVRTGKWGIACFAAIKDPEFIVFMKKKFALKQFAKPFYQTAPLCMLHFTPYRWFDTREKFDAICQDLLDAKAGWIRIAENQIISGMWEIPVYRRSIRNGREVEEEMNSYLVISTWDTVEDVAQKVVRHVGDEKFDLFEIFSILSDSLPNALFTDLPPHNIFFQEIMNDNPPKESRLVDDNCSPIKIYATMSSCFDEEHLL
jgi:hypothetical protein